MNLHGQLCSVFVIVCPASDGDPSRRLLQIMFWVCISVWTWSFVTMFTSMLDDNLLSAHISMDFVLCDDDHVHEDTLAITGVLLVPDVSFIRCSCDHPAVLPSWGGGAKVSAWRFFSEMQCEQFEQVCCAMQCNWRRHFLLPRCVRFTFVLISVGNVQSEMSMPWS